MRLPSYDECHPEIAAETIDVENRLLIVARVQYSSIEHPQREEVWVGC